MNDSANKLSKQRRRRRILMHDDDEDDSTPRKIQSLIQSERSFTTFNETDKKTTSPHTERTISSFSSVEQSKTTTTSRRNYTGSSEVHTSSNESFSKSESSKVGSYSAFTKTEGTYRSYSRTDKSTSSVHKSSTIELPVGVAELSSIANIKGAVGTDSSRPKLHQIGRTDHTSGSLDSYRDFEKITRDDRDVSIIDTKKFHAYHDVSIKEGHFQKSDENSDEHRRFKTNSEKYSYSDKENTKIDYTRSEQHEVKERKGLVAPEEDMSVFGRNNRPDYNTREEGLSSYFHDPNSLTSSTHSIEDLSGRRKNQNDKSKTAFKITPDVRTDEPEELSEMHVASIRDRVRLMRASMGNQSEETEDDESDQDHETEVDIRFSSYKSTDDPMKGNQTSTLQGNQLMTSETETVSTNRSSELIENGSRDMPRDTDQRVTGHIRAETETKTEQEIESVYVNAIYEFCKPDNQTNQDRTEDTKNYTETTPSEFETNDDLKITENVNHGQSEERNNENASGDFEIEMLQNPELKKHNALECEMMPSTTITSEEKVDIEQEVSAKSRESSGNLAEQAADHETHFIKGDITIKSLHQIPPMEVETGYKTSKIPADNDHDLAEKEVDLTDGKQSMITGIYGETPLFEEDKVKFEEFKSALYSHTEGELNKEDEPSHVKTDTAESLNLNAASSGSIQLTATGNVSEEIITIQTGIVTSVEPSAELDESKQLSIPKKTFGSDEVIIIHGVPTRKSYDTQLYKTLQRNTEADKATVNSSEEITQHEMRSTEIPKSLKFGGSKLNLRSYAPRPYQKVHNNPRENQQPRKPSSEIQSREIQSTYFQFQEPSTHVKTDEKSEVNKPPYGALHRPEKQNTHDHEEKENRLMLRESLNGNSNVDKPTRTPSYGEHGDLSDSPMENEDTVEPISYGNATEAQSNDSLQTYTQPFDIPPENKSDDGETFKTSRDEDYSHDSPQIQEDKDEKMSCKPAKVQPNDNLQPCLLLPDVGLETKPESAWQPDTPPHDEETDEFTSYDLPGAQEKASPTCEDASKLRDKKVNLSQPYETPPQDEEANEFMSYDTGLKYVQTEDSIQSRGQLPDVQPEKISIDVWQSCVNSPNEKTLDNLTFHDIHPSETQAKDEQDDPSPYQNHNEQAAAAQTGTKCENTHDETDAGASMLYKYYPTEEPSKESQQSDYPLLTSKSEEDDQPYGTQEHAEPNKLESCNPLQAELEPIHEPKKAPEDIWHNSEHYKYDDNQEEMNESMPYQTTSYKSHPHETDLQELQSFRTPANDLQTQGEKEDVQYLSEKHNARKGSKRLDSHKPDKIQEQEKPLHDAKSEKMAMDTTADYNMETVGIQSDEALSYDVIPADNKETDNGPYQTTRNIPLHTTAPLEFQPIESSPFEPQTFDIDGVHSKQIDSYGINQPHKTVHEELQNVPSETVLYSEEVVMKHWPVTEQLGDLEQEPQPMDTEFENQSPVTTRREVVPREETTVRGLYSENSGTEDTPRYVDKDPVLKESFSHVQIEHVTFEDNKLEPVYAEPCEDISFEPILVLDDISDKGDSNDQRKIEKMLADPENVDVHHAKKFEMHEIMDTEDSQKHMEQSFGYNNQDKKPYSVERHEVRTHETIPYESRANDSQPRQPSYTKEQLSDKEDEETADLEDTEAYEISRRQIRSFKTTSYESQPYEMGQPGSQSLRAWPYKIEPKDKHDDTISDDHLYHTDVYNIQKRELRSYKTTSWESQQYETEPSTLQYSQSRSYETEPRDNESDATLGDRLKDNEALEVNKSDDTISYESFIYDEQPGKLNGQDVIHDPGKRASMLNTVGYSLQNNAPIDSNLDSPPRKEKIPDTYEESQDHDIDPSSAPSVTILRKIRVTKSNRFPTAETPDVKKTGSENTNVPLISEDKSNTNVVVEKVSASKKDVLESMQEEVDKVFTSMEYQAADHEVHFSHSDPPQSKDGLNQYRDTEQQLAISDQTPLRKYRVESNIQLSPFERPESKRLTKSWKSEPILNVDPIDDDRLSKTRRWKSTNFEKKILKQSSVTIELQKPQRRPLLPPAYSVDKLPFETIIRNEVNIKLKKKKRRNSLPSNTMLDTDSDVPDGATSPREILPREIQTEEIERKQVQLSESYETIDALFEDNFEDEAGEIPDYNKENEPDYDETVESSVQSPLKRKNFGPTPLDKKKPRKSRLNIVPLTVRPKSFKDEPTFVVVRQQHSTDTTYGRVESALSYKVHHAVTSETPRDDIVIEEAVLDEKPRDDIVIEETDLDEQLPKQQPHDEETYRVDTKETIADFDEKNDLYTSPRKFKTRNVNDNVIKVPKEPEDIQGSEDGENEPVREPSPQPKLKRSTKRRQRILIDKQDLKEAIGNNEPPILPSMDTTRLQNELFDTNEEPKPIKPAVDVARYLDDDDDNYVSKPPYFGYIPNSTASPPEDLYRSNEPEASPQPSEDFYQHLGKPNAGKAPDTTNGISTDQHLISPINIDQYVGQMVENKVEGKRLDDTMDDLETYEANKEIQRLLEKVSDDEEEPVKPLLPRQTIEVILIDETKKKKKKKPKKTKIETAPDETVFHEPMPNDFELLQPTAAEIVKPVQGKKERVDTKEIAVQTMPVPDDMDSEDDSDQEILQYQQRSTIGGYLINTIPEEQEDESPDQNSGSSIYEQHIYRERGFLFRNTHDHEPTPRRPNQINEKEAYSDPSFLPQKYFSEPTIKHDEERLSEFSPYESNHSPQIHETPQNQSYQPEPWQEEKQPDQPDDEEKGFDFDKSRQDIQSSSTINTEGLLKPIYKPRFEIQDFIEEDHRRQTRLVIEAPPSKKHKMSSPYSPIDDTLLGRDPHQKDEPVPVLGEPQSVTPSYAPKYEIHDFAMQDVEEKLKPMSSTITNGFVLEENEHEIETYPDSEQDLRSDILNQADTEKRSETVASKQDGLTFTESEYLPRLDAENSKDQCLEPLNNDELPTKHDTPEYILPRYEPRFEIQGLIAKESQRDEQPKYGNLTKRTESPVFISPKDPELLSNQPGFEVTSFILNEEPGREEKYNDQESDTDDSLSNLYNQPAYKPRYIMDEVPSNKTYKVDVTLEENKGMPFQPIGKEIIRQTTEAERKEEKRPSYRSQQQPVPDYRATVPLTEQEPVISPYEIGEVVLEPQSQRIGSKPIQTKTRITTSATFVEEEPKPLEEKREPEHTSSAYQPRCEIINFVLQEQPEQPEEFEAKVKKEETKPNRSFRRPKLTVDEIILQEGLESEDESISSESVQKQPATDETVQINLETKFEDEQDFYRPYQPQHKVKVFVLDEDPLLTRALPEKQDESTADNSSVASNELNFTKSAKIPKYKIQDLEREHKVREFVMEEPENEIIPKHPTTDQTVQTSTETTVEDEPGFYRLYEPQHEIKSFVLDEGPLITRGLPKKQDESTTDKSPVSINERNFTRSVNIPKYEIPDLEKEHKAREIVIEEEPENERIPKHPTTDETVQTSTETTVEDEPDFYRPFEPQHEVKSFVLDEGPLITGGLPKKQDESTTDKSHVSINEQNFTRSVNIPKYEIPDIEKERKVREIVIEEQPENERIPKHPTTDETVQTSTETTVEDEPDFYRPFEPQHEVKSFVLDEGPLITGGLPKKQDESTTDKSHVSINEQNCTRSVNIPKYEIPDIEKEHKVREIVIEEQPENERIPKHPTTDETVQTSTETTVEDEPDFYRPFEMQHEVKSFVLDEDPLITGGLPKKQDKSTTDKSRVSINEQNFTRSVNIPKYEIPDIEKEHKVREIVIEEQPENERIPKHPTTDETVQTSTETTVEDEPDFYRSFEPQREVKRFVLEEGPLITRGLPKKQDESTPNRSPVPINELNFTGSVSIPKNEIPDFKTEPKITEFVIEEPKNERIPKHPTTDETVQTSTETTFEDEPDFYRPFEPLHEVKSYVLDEGPLITRVQPKKQDESTADKSHVAKGELNFRRSVNIPKYKIPDLEREHKIREFVIEEEPENERISQQPTINETVQITAETSVEDEPDFYRPFEPQHQVKSFALDEDPLITRDLLEKQDESWAHETPVITNELNFTRSVSIAKYEIPGLEREHKVREFVIEEEPEDERIPKYPLTDETVQTSTETTVEDEPDFYRPFEPQQEVSFVSDEGPLITNGLPKKHDESTADQTPISMNEPDYVRSVNIPKYEMPGTEREDKALEFVIDEKPESERTQKRPVTNEKTQTSIQAMNEEEPDVYRPFQEKDKVKGFVSDEDPLIQQVEPKGQVKTTTGERFVPDYIRSAGNLEQKFTDSELDSRNYQPHMGDETTDQVDAHTTSVPENKPKRPEGQDNIVFTTERQDYSTNVTPYVKEKQEQEIKTISAVKQERIQFRYQQRYKLEDFVLIEEPELDEGPPSTSNEKSYESFRIITGDQGPHTPTPQNQSGNAPPEKGLNQEEVPKETNTHSKFVIGKEEPREITVNTVETSQINYESHQEVETILEDEPSRLDIDYVNDDPSENAGPEFKSDLQTMLSHRYGTKEKAILIAEGESIDKTTSRPLKQENKIEAGLLEDIETQANAFSAENVSKTRNVDDSGNKTDTKFNSPIAADDIRSVENPEEIVENVTGEINPAKTLVLEDEMEHFEPEPQKTMGSVDEKTGISTDKKSAGIETITTERTNELETEDSSQSETDDIIANLAGGKERMDRDENIDIQIVPSYIREVYPTEVTPTERPLLEQEIQEESSENVTIKTMKNIPQIEKREERSIDIATVNEYLRRQTAEETVISNQQEKTQEQTTQLHEEHSELLKTTEETYVYPKDESQPSIAKSLTLISVDAVDGEQEEIPIASESLPFESDGLSQLVKQSSPRQADIKSTTVTEEMEQDTLPKGGEDIAVEMSNMSEIIEHGVEAERVDDINIIAEQTSTEKESAIIYPLNRPEGMIIQLVDDIVEPSQPAFRGTTIIEKPEQRGYLKKGTEHTTIHEISRPAHHELENSRTEFTENIPNSAEQRFVRDVDLQPEIETGPLYTNKGEMIAQDGKKLASADVEYLEMNDVQEVENVNSEEDEIINIGRETPGSTYGWELNFAELSTNGPVMLEIENERQSMMTTIDSVQNNEDIDIITERYQRETVHGLISESQPTRGIAVDHKADLPTTKTERAIMNDEIPSRSIKESKFETRTNMGLVTVYPLNEPQGITIQLIDDIEPVEPEHEGTAVIQKIIDEKPARTIHTPKYYHSEITDTKTTEFLEDIPLANIGQTFARDFKDDIPTTFVDGKSGGIGGDAYDKSEHAVIKGSLVSGDPVSNTHTREQFNETDAINHEESEAISIASGTSSLDLQDDITIEPSYVRQVDPSGLVITETIGGKEEIVQLNELPSTTGESDTAQRKLERSMEIKTVTELYEPGQSIRMLKPTNSEFDQEHIYARVNKELLGIRDENTKPMALVGKSSVDSVIVDHQPGATTIAMVEKRSVPVFEKGQIDDKDFEREVYNRNSEQGEISQSTDTMPRVSYTGTKDQGSLNKRSLNEGVVWMTVRHSKKLFSAGGNERIITLPIVNNLSSSNFSPTEDLDFDLDNDGEMFSQRHKQDASGEYYTSTRVLGLEEISVHRESIMMKESEQDERQQSGTRTSVLDDKSEVAEGTSRIAMEQFKEPGDGEIQEQDVEKKEVRELQQERYHDYPRADEYENECIESASLKTSEDVSRQSMRETITVDNWTAENDVWCTVKLKRWESDIRGIHSSNKFKGKGASELSSSTASIDGTYEEDTDRPQSPNSEISMKTESSVPWKSVTRKSKKGANAKDHQAGESIGYSMQLTATDAGVLMTEEDTLSGVETLDTESTVSTNMGDVTTLPWIEVQKRGSIRQRFSITKKKRDGTLKGVTHTTDGKDRLLLVKIPQTMLLEIENDDKMLETEVEIPWMELDQSAGEMQGCLPWVELAEQSKNTETDRILMLKISRQMILKASKDSKTGESEIQLPWNDVVKYWVETGQITPGSLARSDKPGSANIAITFPSESASDNQLLEEHPNLPNMRLILPKKRCLDGSLRLKPMITVNEKRNIKVRINKSVKRKHDWSTILRLSKSERRKKYANVTGEDDWVVLADGTKWWRLQIGDMEKVSQLSQISDGQKFENYFEISSEDTDGRESVDFNEFAKELGTKKQKQFSFVIDPKNLLSSAKSF